ncbi:hypothetical protein, partial [Planomonospora parontospora]|uniref:hypothetical protein n=1 Tax=Planomonospora parontospora TaxID=58119 RepID=UPI0019514320
RGRRVPVAEPADPYRLGAGKAICSQKLERAQQQADRARRRYRLAEPEDRPVVNWRPTGSRSWPLNGN